jgi:hypothetical protein
VREAREPEVATAIRQNLRYELNQIFSEYSCEYGYLYPSYTLNQTHGNHKKMAIPIPRGIATEPNASLLPDFAARLPPISSSSSVSSELLHANEIWDYARLAEILTG